MNPESKAYFIGGGVGSLVAAAFMIRDGGIRGNNISIFDAMPIMGGSLDGAGDPVHGYSLRGGRMLTTDNYECMWDLYKTIPSLTDKNKTVFDETVEFNEKHKANSMARLEVVKVVEWTKVAKVTWAKSSPLTKAILSLCKTLP